VLTPTFRYHPSIIAQIFATLGCMFPDRIVLGVGTGESLNEAPATSIIWPEFKERFGRLREAIAFHLWERLQSRVTREFVLDALAAVPNFLISLLDAFLRKSHRRYIRAELVTSQTNSSKDRVGRNIQTEVIEPRSSARLLLEQYLDSNRSIAEPSLPL
jgi:hypothetical protein